MGTQIPFDRFLKMLDEVSPLLRGEKIIAQTIPGEYKPTNFETVGLISPQLFARYVQNARVIVSHAGMGNIITALMAEKPIVVVPRIAAQGEHRNEHQLATAKRLGEKGLVQVANNATELLDLLNPDRNNPLPTIPAQAPQSMVDTILKEIEQADI